MQILLLFIVAAIVAECKVIDFERTAGAVPNDSNLATAWQNGAILNATFKALTSGDVLVIPNKTFHLMGGIQASQLSNVVVVLDGTLVFSDDMASWPRDAGGGVLECLQLSGLNNVTLTSTGMGTLDGQGATWWGFPGIGYLERGENRPRLLRIAGAAAFLMENWTMQASPYWTFFGTDLNGAEIRNSHISNRRTQNSGHGIIDLTAFNTDGFDVSGRNVWIHDCSIWAQDDCIAVKDNAENMLFERIEASGLGLVIGSIGSGQVVRNITFRDCHMKETHKGIYMKFRSNGHISDILYENIYMERPIQWAIWIGPAQQSDSSNLCAAHPCSLCWPTVPFSQCNAATGGFYKNIVLRNVTIQNPLGGTGVILAHGSSPMQGVTFDNVRVIDASSRWLGGGVAYHTCENVNGGIAKGNTWPVPSCFLDETDWRGKAPDDINILL